MSVSERITKILKIKNFTNEYIAERINSSKGTISNYKNGKSDPSTNFILYLLKEHPNLNLRWLYLGKGEMFLNDILLDEDFVARLENFESEIFNLKSSNKQLSIKFEEMIKIIGALGGDVTKLHEIRRKEKGKKS